MRGISAIALLANCPAIVAEHHKLVRTPAILLEHMSYYTRSALPEQLKEFANGAQYGIDS